MKPIDPLPPGLQSKVEQFYSSTRELVGRWLSGFEIDFNRHAVKHGPIPADRAVFDMTKLFVTQVNDPDNPLTLEMLAGGMAYSIVGGITAKAKGRG